MGRFMSPRDRVDELRQMIAGWIKTCARAPSDEPPWFADYESSRINTSYEVLKKIQPWFTFVNFIGQALNVMEGLLSMRAVCMMLVPQLAMSTLVLLTFRPLRKLEGRNKRLFGIGLQLVSFTLNMMTRALVAPLMKDNIGQHRAYLFITLSMVSYGSFIGYVPKLCFYMGLVPSFAFSWVSFHFRIGYLTAPTVAAGIAVAAIMVMLRSFADSLHRENFSMAISLRQVQCSLEQVMSAQQSLLGSLFDASCVCTSTGEITQATPQMRQLFDCGESALSGSKLPAFAPSSHERRRLETFIDNAWKIEMSKPAMIQTSLNRSTLPDSSPAAPGVAQRGMFEVRLYCIRLPDVSKVTASMDLWAHGGLFMGLQELEDKGPAEASGAKACEASPDSSGSGDFFMSKGNHGVVFDAGSEKLRVLRSSPIFALACWGDDECGLLDLMPSDVAKEFDDWVYDEVQTASVRESLRSSSFVGSLALNAPHGCRKKLVAKRAWLEFAKHECSDSDETIPVALRLSGVHVHSVRGGDGAQIGASQLAKVQQAGCATIPEADEDLSDDDAISAGGGEGCWDSGDEGSSVMPDDSASQSVRYVRLRRHRESRGPTPADAPA